LHNSLTAGTGSNDVSSTQGWLHAAFAAGGAGSTDSVSFSGGRNIVTGGSENFTVDGGRTGSGIVRLGDGNDQVSLASGYVTLGSSTANTAQDSVSVVRGGGNVTLNGGVDQVTLSDTKQGYDKVQLNGTLLGTTLSAAGSFDSITLTADANAAITETAVNGGLSLVIDGDKAGGIGDISVSGLSQDDLAHITLVGLGAYTVTTDDTPVGGLTLHFAHGSIDLIGLQAISNHLITG
jgi:hypothetical protein